MYKRIVNNPVDYTCFPTITHWSIYVKPIVMSLFSKSSVFNSLYHNKTLKSIEITFKLFFF
jgi:hypothetical protein